MSVSLENRKSVPIQTKSQQMTELEKGKLDKQTKIAARCYIAGITVGALFGLLHLFM